MGLFRIPGIARLEQDIQRLEDDLVDVDRTLNTILERTGRIEEDTDAINASVGDGLKGTVGDIKAATSKTVESKTVTVLDVTDGIDTSLGDNAGIKLNNLATEVTAVGTNVAAVRKSVGNALSSTVASILAEAGQINESVGSDLRALVVTLGTNVATIKTSVGTGLAGIVSKLGETVTSGLVWLQSSQMVILLDIWRQRPGLLGSKLISGTSISQDLYAMVQARGNDIAPLHVFSVWAGNNLDINSSWKTVQTISIGSTHGVNGLRAIIGFSVTANRQIAIRLIDSTSTVLATSGYVTGTESTLEIHSHHPPVANRSYTIQIRTLTSGATLGEHTVALIGENPTSLPQLQKVTTWPELDLPLSKDRLLKKLLQRLRNCVRKLQRLLKLACSLPKICAAWIQRLLGANRH